VGYKNRKERSTDQGNAGPGLVKGSSTCGKTLANSKENVTDR
jgi:hypothetical protein